MICLLCSVLLASVVISFYLGLQMKRGLSIAILSSLSVVASLSIFHVEYFVFLTSVIPYAEVWAVGDLILLSISAFSLGCLSTLARKSRVVKLLSITVVIALGGRAMFFCIAPKSDMGDVWIDGCCMQTSENSCAPSSSATLLSMFDIDSSEKEMASLSLTNSYGTVMSGVYRGLKIKADEKALDVKVMSSIERRALLRVKINEVRHVVVCCDRIEIDGEDFWVIADPACGYEVWSDDFLRNVFDGISMTLVRRSR